MSQTVDRRLRNWPNHHASRFVRADGLTWHVQVAGQGPVLLLLHGTGAATHSWRGILPLLTPSFTIVAPDLPGHFLTQAPATRRLSLPGMSAALAALLRTLDLAPAMAVGHSAGAAIMLRMTLDRLIAPAALVSLNGALLPLRGRMGQLFPPLARLLAGLPLLPSLFAWSVRRDDTVKRLLDDTGSRLDPAGVALYARVVRHPGHAAAALGMMAHWDLEPLVADLPRLPAKLLLVAGDADRTVPPAQSQSVARQIPGARYRAMPALGHLAHEEAPGPTADLITAFARETGVLA